MTALLNGYGQIILLKCDCHSSIMATVGNSPDRPQDIDIISVVFIKAWVD